MWTLPLLLLTACGEDDPLVALRACGDVECQQEKIAPAWEADEAAVRTWVSEIEVDLERSVLVHHLARSFPGAAKDICDLLERGTPGFERCSRLNLRPHLNDEGRAKSPPPRQAATRSAPGPSGVDLLVPEAAAAPWADADEAAFDAALEGCALERSICAEDISGKLAASGDLRGAGIACWAGHPDQGTGYGECLFKAAEEAARARGMSGLNDAVTMCTLAGWVAPMCLAHVQQLAGPKATPADAPDPAAAQAAIAAAEAFDAALGGGRAGEMYADRFWAIWMHSSYNAARSATGDLAAVLPEAAQRHARVSTAYKALQGVSDVSGLTLDQAVALTREALAARSDAPPVARELPLIGFMRQQFWGGDASGEEALPAAWSMGPGRRTWVDDPEIDLQIAVLEAAAQLQSPPPASFFLSAVDPARAREVRWTGARIGAVMEPGAARSLSDEDPLVQAHLAGTINTKGPPGGPGKGPPPPGGPPNRGP